MRKLLFAVLFVGLLAGPALAQTKPFEASVLSTGDLQAGQKPVYQRYWSPSKPQINPNCGVLCGASGVDCEGAGTPEPLCRLGYSTKAPGGYRGYTENIFNFGAAFGTVFHTVYDYQSGAGTGNHIGYYAWLVGAVNEADQSQWNAAGCAGTNTSSCLGANGPAEANDEINVPPNQPAGTISKIGGLSPIPVPKAQGGSTNDTFNLAWTAAVADGRNAGVAAAGYDLYVAKTAACAAPAETAFAFVKTVAGTSTTVTAADINLGATETPTFALKVRFPGTSDGDVITTKYLSANGQCFARGLASTVYDLAARHVGGTNVEVTFKTALEDGVQSFDILRATTQNGQFTKVGNVAAKGEPSSYSFIDTIQAPQGPVRATGLFYKVVAIDVDNGTTSYGPVKASLPAQGQGTIRQQMKKPAPKR